MERLGSVILGQVWNAAELGRCVRMQVWSL